MREGVVSGESTVRELAAFLIDSQNFSGVPETALALLSHESFGEQDFLPQVLDLINPAKPAPVLDDVAVTKTSNFRRVLSEKSVTQLSGRTDRLTSCSSNDSAGLYAARDNSTVELHHAKVMSSKLGTLQAFCKNVGPIEDFSEDLFSSDEIHKIGILDVRICNLDRNAANILVDKTEEGYKLIPIDHGLSIPDTLNVSSFDLAWMSFSQAELPFSQKSLDYIQNIDVDKDIELLESTLSFRPICLRNIKISTTLLKMGAQAGLTLAQIGEIMCRSDDDDSEPSELEKIISQAEEQTRLQKIKTGHRQSFELPDSTRDGSSSMKMVAVLDQHLSAAPQNDLATLPGRERSKSTEISLPRRLSEPTRRRDSSISSRPLKEINLDAHTTENNTQEPLAPHSCTSPWDSEFFVTFRSLLLQAILTKS